MARIPLPEPLAHTPFTTRQGKAFGLGVGRMRGSDLQQPFRGVRAPKRGPLAFDERCRTYRQKMPAFAFFCGLTAARVMGIPLPHLVTASNILHVAVPPGKRAPTGRQVQGHTFAVPTHGIRNWNGIPVSSPEYTWCALGETLTLSELVAAGDFLIHHRLPLTSLDSLRETLGSYAGRRGLRTLKLALPLLDSHSESPQESILRVTLVQGGITGLTANLPIRTSGGFNYRADLAIADRKVILEYQSRFHDASEEFCSDMTRTSRLEADGWYVMQVNMVDLRNPNELLQRIATVLRARPYVR